MFKKIASDALGLSDIGAVIKPADYDKVDADDYVMNEEDEKIFFLIKSKTDEYCFTNQALIHVDGTSAISKKRLLKRLDYYKFPITNVMLETAGTVDLDAEIKFVMGNVEYSIDVKKRHIEELKDLYKSLLKIGIIQQENAHLFSYAQKSLDTAAASMARTGSAAEPQAQFKAVNEYAFAWTKRAYESYVRKDFGAVFEKFINN